MDDLTRLRKKIKADKRYKSIRSLFKTSDLFQLPVADYRDEVRSLFKMLKFRSLSVTKSKALDNLAEAVVQNQAYRSRMTEIYAHLTESTRTLDRLLERFMDYATVTYARDLKNVGAARERTSAVRASMETYYKYADEARFLMEEIDLYLKDIDKAGFAAKALVDTLALINQREYGLPNKR